MDTMTGVWSWIFAVSMLILLGVICLSLYRRLGLSRPQKALVAILFLLTAALLAYHTATTYDQRQKLWSALPLNLSPEADRPRGGGEGASDFNRTKDFHPRSKVFGKD
jgi:hypothetical protein